MEEATEVIVRKRSGNIIVRLELEEWKRCVIVVDVDVVAAASISTATAFEATDGHGRSHNTAAGCCVASEASASVEG